jgi:uncharacterized protein YceH (UPF0502 family)
VDILLTDIETRVLGSLVEKEITTPEYYPLSLNALVNACNQKSNREPLMNLDEDAVKQALRTLQAKDLAGPANTTDSRVTKYEQRVTEMFNFTRQETAVLCVLLLRGPQTPGELRSRAERLYPFDDLNQVQSALQRLMNREPPLAKILARQAGTKESRYAHLFAGDPEHGRAHASPSASPQNSAPPERAITPAQAVRVPVGGSNESLRLAQLEEEISGLKKTVEELQQQFSSFRKQFE